MERNELLNEFKTRLRPYVTDKEVLEDFDEQTHLTNDLHINSAHVIDVVLDVENAFDILIDDASFEKITTVGSCIDLIIEKTAEKLQ
ncbi:acyl carrier protein [Chitinophaga sp. MD30]|uniref:acyl carrier protein n=1 Tax=Chitinophaga sp. MD30 TaxID=2033437 RepID=UPI000BAF5969|nr:acyl carrier protein [Chitinophaga sp. MD30]ASZ12174.1 acyl carrier protein [Chitinophaga sp. MD30]